ncbi:MAG TPA: PIN domain-containing protein [Pyrinomonadaceae bacterium]|nr:PIN domain-containing protein [Pyrinomonadaceae bacterium]
MAEFLIDTNVLSRIFTGDRSVKEFIETLDAAVCTVVYAECLQGSKSNREKQIVESYLSRFEFCNLTSGISKQAIDLISDLLKYARPVTGRRPDCCHLHPRRP